MKELSLEEMKEINGGMNPYACIGSALVFVAACGATGMSFGAAAAGVVGSALLVYASCW